MPAAPRPPRRPNFRETSRADIDSYITGLVPARPPEQLEGEPKRLPRPSTSWAPAVEGRDPLMSDRGSG
jgi:hypothetical protein